MQLHKIDLGIVTAEPFPIGLAATNRILSYSTELAKFLNIKVYITKPTEHENDLKNTESEGIYNGIAFQYVNSSTIWPVNAGKFKKALLLLKGFRLTASQIRNDNPKSILLVSNDIFYMIGLRFLSWIFGFNYYQEKSEKPPVIKKKTNILYKLFYLSIYRLFDGIIVMTRELKEYFLSLGQKNIYHLPMTVDFYKFANAPVYKTNSKHFLYCGGGNYERDGLLDIINAFIHFAEYNPDYELHIIGPPRLESSYYQEMLSSVINSPVSEKILFLGKKTSSEIPGLLISAICLLMAPPKDFDSGGFPTKLGEYLSTGVPVICTKVSEIPDYLNESCALLVEPANQQQLYDALVRVVNNKSACSEIAIKGQEVVKRYFTIESYKDDLIKFLNLNP